MVYRYKLTIMENVIWSSVKDYEEFYRVSSAGDVYSKRYNKISKPYLTECGYQRITLQKDGQVKNFLVHRLVAQAFIPNPENKPTVNHKDGNKLNNHVTNLEWATMLENVRHADSSGLRRDKKGEKSYSARLTEEQVLKIRILSKQRTLKSLAIEFGVSLGAIESVKKYRSWKHI